MIDFSALVLGPSMAIFARPVTVTPSASQPGAPPYAARGVWSSRPVDVATEMGIASSQVHTLGLRLAEFEVPPAQGDGIEIPAFGGLPEIGPCLVEDSDEDGQGGAVLTLKILEP